MEAVEVIIAGKEKKDRILSEKEKRIVSFHEVGHALATAVQKHTQPVHKITIVPRTMGSLGYTMQMPEEEERYLMSKDEIVDQITVFLAGRAAEELVFNVQTTGASNDIEKATNTAKKMVTKFGMSDKLGPILYGSGNQEVFIGRDMGQVKDYSEKTAAAIDDEIHTIITDAYDKTVNILKTHIDKLHQVAQYLIKYEKMNGEDFAAVMDGTFVMPMEETEENNSVEEN